MPWARSTFHGACERRSVVWPLGDRSFVLWSASSQLGRFFSEHPEFLARLDEDLGKGPSNVGDEEREYAFQPAGHTDTGEVIVAVPDFPGVLGTGPTKPLAMRSAERALYRELARRRNAGVAVPEPSERPSYRKVRIKPTSEHSSQEG